MSLLPSPADALRLAPRYDVPRPRYTSYPTAPHFSDAFDATDYIAALSRTHAAPGLSLYVHLPFCPRLCLYCGCHTKITQNRAVIARYLAYVVREMERVAALLPVSKPVQQLHWGGGTPTYLLPEEIIRLMQDTRALFPFADGAEISVEADPRRLTADHLDALADVGFNRISFGVQDLDEQVQQAIGRIQPLELVEEAVTGARACGFERISLDLIYGLPFQTLASYKNTLDAVRGLAPDRLAVFSYAHVPWMKKHQRAIPTDALPSAETKLRLFLQIAETLTDAGYRHVGMDHFARPDDTLCRAQDAGQLHRNFQGYTTHPDCALLAFGVSGIGQVADGYVQNEKNLPAYYRMLDADTLPIVRGLRLTADDARRRHVIMRLMCDFFLDKPALSDTLGVDFDTHFDDALESLAPMEDDGLIEVQPNHLRVTPLGRLFIRNIAAAFDAYLTPEASITPRYSQAV